MNRKKKRKKKKKTADLGGRERGPLLHGRDDVDHARTEVVVDLFIHQKSLRARAVLVRALCGVWGVGCGVWGVGCWLWGVCDPTLAHNIAY